MDDNGWAVGNVRAIAPDRAWSLFSPDAASTFDEARWSAQARRFFRAEVALASPKRYPSGAAPITDEGAIWVTPNGGSACRVEIVTLPLDRAPDVRAFAERAILARGGAGFDALLARAKRLWQISALISAQISATASPGDNTAPLLCAAILASVLLAPIVPPEGGTIFGVKTARERLAANGLRV